MLALLAAGIYWLTSPGTGNTAADNDIVESFMHIHGLGIAPWDPQTVYVSTHHGLIAIDEAGQWRYLSEERHDFMGFQVHPQAEGTLYSSGHPAPGSGLPNPLGLMISEDAGRNWEPVSLLGEVDFHAMAVQYTDGDVIYGWNVTGTPALYRSFDAGASWEVLAAEPVAATRGALTLAVDPHERERILAGTRERLLASEDGGENWQVLWEAPVSAITYAHDDSQNLWAYAATADGGLMYSNDGGASWEPAGFLLEDDLVGYIAIHPQDVDVIYLGTYGQNLFRTTDGGQTWEQLARDGQPLPAP